MTTINTQNLTNEERTHLASMSTLEGIEAHKNNINYKNNPYPDGSLQHTSWTNGYIFARDKSIDPLTRSMVLSSLEISAS